MTPTTDPSQLPLPPGNLGLPFIGETIDFFRDPDFARKRFERYGPIFKTSIFGQTTVICRSIAANRFILANENRYFRVSWPPSTRALLGPLSLALQSGAEHGSRRKLLAQAFSPRALGDYLPAMAAIADGYLQRWEGQTNLTWYPELRDFTFDIAAKLFVGLDNGAKTELGHLFETWCEGLFSLPLPFPQTRFGKAKRARKQMLALLEEIIRSRQEAPDPGRDALGLLLQARDDDGDTLSLDELKDQVLLLLFAGHETLTSALAAFCLLVAQHPDVLAKLRAEQEALAFPSDMPPTPEQLKAMTYLETVLKEVLRFTPPVGGGFRTILETCEVEGYRLESGWSTLYQISQLHKQAEEFPEPERFNPDRFADELPKLGFVPFGGGLRECLGKEFARLEMKLFAVLLLRGYDWTLLPDQDLSLEIIPTPRPRDGLRVAFAARSPS